MYDHDYFDVVIVGAGMAGLAAAAGSPGRTVVLETGVETDLRHKNLMPEMNATKLWHRTDTDSNFRRHWSSTLPPHFLKGSGLRQRVGGRSLYWHGVCLPLEQPVLLDWPSSVAEVLLSAEPVGGSYAAAVRRLEDWLSRKGAKTTLVGCRSVREEKFLGVLRDAGFDATPVPQASVEVVVGNELRQVPYSPVEDLTAGSADILTDCRVESVLPNRTRLRLTVRSTGAVRTIEAKRVVLAAGTIENTRIVGQLKAHLHGVSEIVFPGLNDHIVQGFVAAFPRALLGLPNSHSRAFCWTPAVTDYASNLFWDILCGPCSDTEYLAVWTMGEKLPSKSAVCVSRTGTAFDVSVMEPLLPEDLLTADRQVALLGDVAERLLGVHRGAVWLTPDHYARGEPNWMTALEATRRHRGTSGVAIFPYVYPLGSVDHEAGTLPLGRELGLDGSVPEVPALSVVGPATFPRTGAANPSLTTLALARDHFTRKV